MATDINVIRFLTFLGVLPKSIIRRDLYNRQKQKAKGYFVSLRGLFFSFTEMYKTKMGSLVKYYIIHLQKILFKTKE